MCEDLGDDNRVCDVRWRPPDITRSLPPQFGQMVRSRSKTRFSRCAHVRGAVGFFVAGTMYGHWAPVRHDSESGCGLERPYLEQYPGRHEQLTMPELL